MTDRDFILGELKMMCDLTTIPGECKPTLKKAIDLLETEKPVTPNLTDNGFVCPKCGRFIGDRDDAGNANYCIDCGAEFIWP